VNVKTKFKLNNSHKKLLFVSLMFVLLSSLFICVFVPNVEGQSIIQVGTESELKEAVSNAKDGVPTVIALNKDIALKGALYIVDNKNITLTSNSNVEFKLFNADDQFIIAVMNGGELKLDGIIITHVEDARGSGVYVDRRGTLHMYSGKISGNSGGVRIEGGVFVMSGGEISDNSYSGVTNGDDRGSFVMSGGEISRNSEQGVTNGGSFVMSGGKILDNNAGGVYNSGSFVMSGGEISRNQDHANGGVYNLGSFVMSGGEISRNIVRNGVGVGVNNHDGNFSMSGGVISGNSAVHGGGVATSNIGFTNHGTFELTGGKISGNTAAYGGGVYIGNRGSFVMSGGEISDNDAGNGGGVHNSYGISNSQGNFVMTAGAISNNKATNNNGGGVYNEGNFVISGGTISGNTAANSGGGVWVDIESLDNLFVSDGVVFSNNRASASYDRNSIHDEVYNSHIGSRVTWTTPFTQGYNNYDISYINDTPTGPEPSEPAHSPNPSGSPTGSAPSGGEFDFDSYLIFVIIAPVLIVAAVVGLVFYFKKKK
jgi:hypothetical protein